MAALSPLDRDNVELLLACPILLRPYSDTCQAVSLVAKKRWDACGHPLSKDSALRLFEKVKLPKCPICREEVTHFIPNPAIQQLAELLRGKPVERLEPSVVDPREIPFPKERGRFTLTLKTSNKDGADTNLAHVMQFTNQEPKAEFNEFALLEYDNGRISFMLKWRSQEGSNYLTACGLPPAVEGVGFHHYIAFPEIQKVFAILTCHNTIDEPHKTFLQERIDSGKWIE